MACKLNVIAAIAIAVFAAAPAFSNRTGAQEAGPVLAQANPAGGQSGSAGKRRPAGANPPAGLQIACTRAGCHPIPRGCRIEPEFNWDGLPTGFDAVICPLR